MEQDGRLKSGSPAEAVYFPALQSAQVVKEAPTAAECSPTQSVQTVAALAPEYLPAAQLVQSHVTLHRGGPRHGQSLPSSFSLSLARACALSIFLCLSHEPLPVDFMPDVSQICAHARTHSNTHETHVSSFAYCFLLSPSPFLSTCPRSRTMWITGDGAPSPYAGSYHVPSATKAAQHFSEVQQVEESSSGKKLCKVELEKASVDLATSGDVIKQLQQTLQDKHSPP